MQPQKLITHVKTRFPSKVIIFEETLEFKQTIITSYGKQKIITLQQKFQTKAQVWAIAKAIT